MSVTHHDTARFGLGTLFARLGALVAEAFVRAEGSQHRRLGSCFLSPEAQRDIRRAARDAYGLPCK